MVIAATSLPETVNSGQSGELTDTAAAYKALNAITAALTGANPTDAALIRAALSVIATGAQITDAQIPAYFLAVIDRSVNNQPARTTGLRSGRPALWLAGTGNPTAAVTGDIAIGAQVAAPPLSTLVFDGTLEGLQLADGTAINATNTQYSTPNVGGGTNSITYTTTDPVTGTASAKLVGADAGAVCTLGKASIAGAPISTWSTLLDFRINKLPDANQVICRGYNDAAFTAAQSSFSAILSTAGAVTVLCGVGAAAGVELTIPTGVAITAGARWRLQLSGKSSSNALAVKLDNGPGTTAVWSQTVTPATGHEVSQVTGARFGWGNADANATMWGELSVGSGDGFLAA